MTLPQWWGGTSSIFYTVLYLFIFRIIPLACQFGLGPGLSVDYGIRGLERAGITISKRHNCLKADVVKALQFVKCLIQRLRDLLLWEPPPTSVLELDLEVAEDRNSDWVDAEDPSSWDSLIIDIEESDSDSN